MDVERPVRDLYGWAKEIFQNYTNTPKKEKLSIKQAKKPGCNRHGQQVKELLVGEHGKIIHGCPPSCCFPCQIQPYRGCKICCLTTVETCEPHPNLRNFLHLRNLKVQLLTTGARPQYLWCTGKHQDSSAVKDQWVSTVMPIDVPTSTVGVDIGTVEQPYWCQPNIWLLHCPTVSAHWSLFYQILQTVCFECTMNYKQK